MCFLGAYLCLPEPFEGFMYINGLNSLFAQLFINFFQNFFNFSSEKLFVRSNRLHALFFRLRKIYFCEGVFKIREGENIFCEGEIAGEKRRWQHSCNPYLTES
jgi:hypothetical protein